MKRIHLYILAWIATVLLTVALAHAQTVNPPIIPPQSVGNPIPPQYSVLNLAALKLLNPTYIPSGALVNRQSYTAPPDNGYANYLYSASPCTLNAGAGDNGSQVIASTGGCWNVVYTDGVVRLGIFGPDPSHTAASDTAVANWLNACNGSVIAGSTTTGGNRCFAERGNYKITSASVTDFDLGFNQGGGLVMYGAGAYATNFDFVTNGGYFRLHNSQYTGFFYSRMMDMGFTCVNTTGLGGCFQIGASYADAVNGGIFENMRAANSTFAAGSAGVVVAGFYNGDLRNITTSDGCNIYNNYGICTSAIGGDSLKIYQMAFSKVQGSFAGASNGIHILGTTVGQSVYANHFDALDLEVDHTNVRIDTVSPQGAYNNVFTASTYLFCNTQSGCRVTGVAGVNTLVGGSGYVNGSYGPVAVTGGSGSGMTAYATVAGGAVTSFIVYDTGTGFTVGDTLTISNTNLGGSGSGFSIKVASLVTIQGYAIVSPVGNVQTFNNVFDIPVYTQFLNPTDGTCTGATSAQGIITRRGSLGISTPAVPASTTQISNTTTTPVLVTLYGGTVTGACFGPSAGTCLTQPTPIQFIMNPCDKMSVTYSVAPVMIWQPTQ